jgi:hypothetical protein
VKTRKGTFVFDEKAAHHVRNEAEEFGNEFPLDYAHAMFTGFALNPAEAGKAAGWFRPEVRGGELWAASVTWTADATRYLKNREYRYISPTFEHEDKRITRLLNVALTNIPASHNLQPLMAHSADASAWRGTAIMHSAHGFTTEDGIEVPSRKELALLGLSAEQFIETQRKMVQTGTLRPARSATGSRVSAAGRRNIDVPSPKVLAMLGMTADEYVEQEQKLVAQGRL